MVRNRFYVLGAAAALTAAFAVYTAVATPAAPTADRTALDQHERHLDFGVAHVESGDARTHLDQHERHTGALMD